MSESPASCASCGMRHHRLDRFCEQCGARIAASGDDTRDHWELDLGKIAGATDRGRVHDRNEDAVFISATADAAIAVVSDGVSTSHNPQHAAQLAADTVGTALLEALARRSLGAAGTFDAEAETRAAIDRAQRAVSGIAPFDDLSDSSSACTLVSSIWDGSHVTIGWVGDSRAYWIASDEARCLTTDDSWAQEQVDSGAMTQRTALADPRAHMITRWLGADAIHPYGRTASFTPRCRGRLILCSDGFWNYAPTAQEIAALVFQLPQAASSTDVMTSLMGTALAAGARDNVTVTVTSIFH